MGRLIEGGAKEENVTLKKETQADGRKSSEGCNGIMSMSFLWRCQEDAFSLPNLRTE